MKAPARANLDVGDKANDAVRIDGRDLRCKVVGEGANLGFTQAGRIAFALAGGRIDTDAIDNSAGVDTSDHEVNIKILTGMAERAGELASGRPRRPAASMTDEVAGHVLAPQLRPDPGAEPDGGRRAAETGRPGAVHGRPGEPGPARPRASRACPTPRGIAERAGAGKGLTRPELAVLLAYGKLDLFDDIVAGRRAGRPLFRRHAGGLFPRGPAALSRRR